MGNKCKHFLNAMISSYSTDFGLLLLRLFIGILMLTRGIAKISNFDTLSSTFPDPLGIGNHLSLILITTAETAGSVFIIIGLLLRLAVLPMIFSMIVAAFLTPATITLASSELAILYLSVYIALLFTGPGRLSIDYSIYKKIDGRRNFYSNF